MCRVSTSQTDNCATLVCLRQQLAQSAQRHRSQRLERVSQLSYHRRQLGLDSRGIDRGRRFLGRVLCAKEVDLAQNPLAQRLAGILQLSRQLEKRRGGVGSQRLNRGFDLRGNSLERAKKEQRVFPLDLALVAMSARIGLISVTIDFFGNGGFFGVCGAEKEFCVGVGDETYECRAR